MQWYLIKVDIFTRRRRPPTKHARVAGGGKRKGSGRPKGTLKGRKQQICIVLRADLYDFAKKQGPGYIERLVAEDKKRQEEQGI